MHITNTHGRGKKSPQWFLIAVAALSAIALFTPAHAQSLGSAFKSAYHLNNIGVPSGLSSPSGALAFPTGNPNLLYVAGGADSSSGAIYSIGVVRDGNGHITGFTGSLAKVASAPDIDGGLVICPSGLGLYTKYPDNAIGEILPGGTSPIESVSLTGLGVFASTGGLGMVPAGFPDAGHLKITSFDRGAIYDTTLSAGPNGTENISQVGSGIVYFGNSVESVAFVPAGNPDFGSNTELICNSTFGSVQAYTADSSANPILSTENDFVTGISSAAGIVVDPLTHDVLVEDQGTNGISVISGFANAALTRLSPTTAVAGTSFTLTVTGAGFLPGARLQWNGTALTTTVSGTQLTASVSSSVNGLLSNYPSVAAISVLNADGTKSNSLNLSVTAPGITITSLSPASVKANTGFTLTVNGTNFRSGAAISWNGIGLPTTYVGSTKLTAAVPQSDNPFNAPYPTSATVTVTSPGSASTATASVAITEPTPILSSYSPASVAAGSSSFTLDAYGNGFVNGATINWNGVSLPTSYVNANHLTANIDSSLVVAVGSEALTVTNPTTGGTSKIHYIPVTPTTITFVSVLASRNPTTGVITIPLYVLNTGNVSANSLQLTNSCIGSIYTTTPIPIGLGDLAPSSLATATLTFPGTAGASGTTQTLTISGSYSGGSFLNTMTIILP